MTSVDWQLISRAFPPLEGEAEENVNGIIGKGLCRWLQQQLPAHGQPTEEQILAEDFGWLLFLTCEHPLWIGCTLLDPDESLYHVQLVAEFPRRWFSASPDPQPHLDRAAAALRALFAAASEIERADEQ